MLLLIVWLLPESAPAAVPPNFVISDVGDGWNEVVGITFDEANRMYVWERPGRVWIVENGVKSATPLIDISEEVSAWNDLGCLGFALDPKFRLNGYIYMFYVVDHYYLDNFGTPGYNPTANDYFRATIGRLTRYTARASDNFRSVDPASRKILIGETKSTGIPITYNTHSVGTLMFGTDGTLLASTGDGGALSDQGSDPMSYYTMALSEGIIKTKENIGAFRSQMVDCHSGKILRLDPATGDGVPSNPFYDAANPRSPRSRVYALGFRNPFRMSLKPGTGSHNPADCNPGVLFLGDVGYQTWEEVTMITGPAQNAGWPLFEGFTQFPPGYESFNPPNPDAPNPRFGIGGCTQQYFTFRDLLKEATLGTPSWPNPCNTSQQVPASIPHFTHTRPMADWKHPSGPSRCGIFVGNNAGIANIGATNASIAGPQFGGSCAIGGVMYNADHFPASYKGTYFFIDFTAGWLKNMTFDSNNVPVQVNDFGTGFDGSSGMIVHPVTGELYVGNVFYGLRKISYGGNAAPKAVATYNAQYGPAPLTVQFSGSASTDPEGGPLTYRWDFGDGSAISTVANPAHTFSAPTGVPTRYDVTLTVTDNQGASNSTTFVISPNNTPPSVTITSPVDGSFYPLTGDTVYALTATVSDAEHSMSQLSPAWQTILHHNTHMHPNPIDTNWSTSAVISPFGCDGDTYWYRIILTVTDAAGLSTTKEVKLYPDCTTNTPPSISNIPDQIINAGQSTGPISFTIGDAQTNASSLTVSGASSNPTLVPTANIVFGGSGSNRTVNVTPASGQSGTATITVTVSDGVFNTSDTFVLSVFPANNTPPTISGIGNQTINEDTTAGPLSFTIGDNESAAANLSLTRASSNTTLVPVNNIAFGGSGASRTVTVTPVANLSGSATITITVSDGQFSSSTNFVVTVSPINDPPTISNISDQTVSMSSSTGPLSFTVGDVETAAGNLSLSATSSNLTLVPISGIVFGGSGADRTVSVTPITGLTGTSLITVTVSDGTNTVTDTFLVTVNLAIVGTKSYTNAAAITIPDVGTATPYPSTIAVSGLGGTVTQVVVRLNGFFQTFPSDVDIMLVGPTGQKVMLMSDVGGGAGVTGINLTLSDTAVGGLPQAAALASGTFKPTDFESGDPFPAPVPAGTYATVLSALNNLNPNGTWSLYAIDDGAGDAGGLSGGWSISITTTGPPTSPPTISDIANQSTAVNTPTAAIPFTVGDPDTALASLTLSGSSSNQTLVPNGNIVFGGSGANRTVTVTPATGQSGTVGITVTVSDGANTASDTFLLTVNVPNNTAPTISGIANQSVNEDTATGAISFTIGDAETPATLTLGKGSSNPALVPTNNIVFGGSGTNRTVTVTPATDQNGTALITVNVSDGQFTVGTNFLLTVNPVNDPPTLNPISDVTVNTNSGLQTIPLAGISPGPADESSQTLTITATSSNPTLIPDPVVNYTNPSASGNLAFTPAPDATGTATITVTVDDLQSQNDTITRTFVITVGGPPLIYLEAESAVLTAPMVAALSPTAYNGQFIYSPVGAAGSAAFQLNLPQAGTYVVWCRVIGSNDVSDSFLVSMDGGVDNIYDIALAGVSPDWQWNRLNGRAVANPLLFTLAQGSHTLLFKGREAMARLDALYITTDQTFVPPTPVNTSPTISAIADQTVTAGSGTGPISFTISDAETPAASLLVSGSSSNTTLVLNANIVFGGTGANRTVIITPVAGLSGTATITVTVTDGIASATDTFVLTVLQPANTPPTISTIADPTINEDTSTAALAFTIGDAESPVVSLALSAGSSNPILVPTDNIVFGGSGANRTVTVTPAADQSGTATITVTVGDGELTTNTTFLLTVNGVNDAPTISSLPNQTIDIGGTTGPVSFTVADVDTPVDSLSVSRDSSNPTLVPLANIIVSGTGATRSVTVTAAAGQTGTSTIALIVSDGARTATNSFVVTVTSIITQSFSNAAAIIMTNVGAAVPYPSVISVSGLGGRILEVTLQLNGLTHTWPADIDVLLVGPTGQRVVVMSDVGAGNPVTGIDLTLSDGGATNLPQTTALASGTFKPTDFESGDAFPAPAPSGTPAATLAAFNGLNPDGTWSLYVADDGTGDNGSFDGGWTLVIKTAAPLQTPQITWANPAAITYGAALSAVQLNATANVPGTFAYSPAVGAVLAAGNAQVLSTIFTPTDAATYKRATNTVLINVLLAPLQITADAKTRLYGSANPPLTATYSGFVNGDGVSDLTTAVSLTTAATAASPVGSYLIIPSGATAANYAISYVTGILSVTRAPLTITADDKTRLFARTNPPLTASYVGFVNGDTAASLTTPVSLSTIATVSSAVGTYPIVASGATAANYNITHVNGTLTILPQASPVVTLSTNLLNYTEGNGAVLLDPLATLTDSDSTDFDTGNLTVEFTAAGASEDRLAIRSQGTGPGQINVSGNQVSYGGIVIGLLSGGTNGTSPLVVTFNQNSTPAGAEAVLRSVTYEDVSSTPSTLQRLVRVTASDGDSGTSAPKTIAINITGVAENAVITWANPAAIIYGTALGGAQLNATANVPGAFAYNPAQGAVLQAGNGQPLSVVFTPSDTINYRSVTQAVSIDVLKHSLVITAADKTKIYGTANPALTATYLGFVNGDSTTSLTTPVSLTTTATVASPVGNYPITPSGATAANYAISYVTGILSVTRAPLTIAADDKTRVFGHDNPSLTATYVGFVNGDTPASLDTAVSLSTVAIVSSPVGTYPIVASGATAANYNITHVNGTLTITPQAVPVVTLSTNLLNYTEGNGAVLLDVLATLTDSDSADFDGGNLTVQFTASGASEDRLAIRSQGTGPGQIDVSENHVSYEGNIIGLLSGGTNGATPLVVTFNQTCTPAAAEAVLRTITYENVSSTPSTAQRLVQVTASDGDGGTSVPKTIAINITGVSESAVITWATPAAITYGAALNGTQLNATANVPGTFLYNPAQGVVLHAGNGQALSAIFTPNDTANYRSATQAVSIDVLKQSLTITAADKTKVYGAANPELTVTYFGFVNGDVASSLTTPVSLATAATAASLVGDYPIIPSGATSPDYAISYVTGTLAVGKAPLVITAHDKTRVVGEPNPPLTADYAGLVSGDTEASLATPVILTTTATILSPAGTYPILASGATAANYDITHVNGTLTIMPQVSPVLTLSTNLLHYTEGNGAVVIDPLAILTDPDSPDFDGGNITVQFLSGTNEDRLGVRSQGTGPGQIDVSGNEVSYQGIVIGSFSGGNDNATPLVITFNQNSTLAAAQAVLRGITYENASSTPLTFQRVIQVTASDGDGGTSLPKTMAIAVAGVPEDATVTWTDPAAITYGTALSAAQLNATANVAGAFVYSPAAGTVLNASNNQTLSVTFTPSDKVNYRPVTRTVSINVLKVSLVITAADKTKVYGSANPALTATYSGFVNGDSISNLITPVSLSTTATTGSPVANYPIIPSGATAANYTITFVNGTLSITQAPLTIIADDKTRVFGQANPPLTATYVAFVNGDNAASLATPVSLSTTATTNSPAGTYPIVASGATAANYNITHVNGTLAVTPAPQPGGTFSFTNPALITVPTRGAATPYPSVINVSDVVGSVTQVVVRLNGLAHTWPSDVDVLMVGPTGQKITLLSDVGGGVPVTNIDLTLSNAAAAALPQSTTLTSGTFRPTDFQAGDSYPAPAPTAGTPTAALTALNGLNPNGTWSLYVVDDGNGDAGRIAGGWSITITTAGPPTAPPTISDIPNQSTTLNTPTAAIPFTLGDADTPVASLSLSGSSSNQILVPNGNIVFGGTGANRTVTVTPAIGQSGTATITVFVTDGANTVSDSFLLTVNVANNTAPTISGIGDQTIDEDTGTGALNFTIGDAETAAGSLTLSRGSSNPALIPTNNIVLGGSGANRTVTVTPATNQTGVGIVTVTVSDGQLTASTSFFVTVNPVNDPPTISNISDQSIVVNGTNGPVAFTIGDMETPAASLTVSGDSSNQGLVPLGNISFGGAGANRTVTVVPAAGQTGTSTITVTVNDGTNSVSDTFVLNVTTLVIGTLSYTNSALITIPGLGAATPYPSTINVSSLGGTITQVVARLNGFTHEFPADVDVLLVGPGGQKVMLMSDAGGGLGVSGLNLTLSGTATANVPQAPLASGTYKPTDYEVGDALPAPAPAGPYGTNLSVFNGLSANGIWSLYAADDGAGDLGQITSGWSLTISTVTGSPPTVPADATGIHHPLISISQPGPDGAVVLTVLGGFGETWEIEASPDLITWKSLATLQSEGGMSTFIDVAAGERPQLFYRVVTQP